MWRRSDIIRFGADNYGDTTIVSRSVEGTGNHTYTYTDLSNRSKQVAKALKALGCQPGDRVGELEDQVGVIAVAVHS